MNATGVSGVAGTVRGLKDIALARVGVAVRACIGRSGFGGKSRGGVTDGMR